jgi:hypothetical protein
MITAELRGGLGQSWTDASAWAEANPPQDADASSDASSDGPDLFRAFQNAGASVVQMGMDSGTAISRFATGATGSNQSSSSVWDILGTVGTAALNVLGRKQPTTPTRPVAAAPWYKTPGGMGAIAAGGLLTAGGLFLAMRK